MSADKKRDNYHSQVLDRVLTILNCYSGERPEATFTELLRETGLSKSTLYRLLQVLEQHRFLEHNVSGTYTLGLKIFELGSIAGASLNLQRLAMPQLEKLVAATGETAHLGVLDGSEVVFIAKVESPHPVRIPSGIGTRMHAYCTGVGKALLCGLSESDLNSYLARTPLKRLSEHTITSHDRLKEELRVARDRGYSVNQGELTKDIRCVGSPIRDCFGRTVAALSVAAPAHRFKRQKILQVAALVREAAIEISRGLGYGLNSNGLNGKPDAPRGKSRRSAGPRRNEQIVIPSSEIAARPRATRSRSNVNPD